MGRYKMAEIQMTEPKNETILGNDENKMLSRKKKE